METSPRTSRTAGGLFMRRRSRTPRIVRSFGEAARAPPLPSARTGQARRLLRRGLDTVADQLLANVALALNAPRAAAVVEQLGIQAMRKRPRGFHHRVEPIHRISGPGQNHEEAHAGE